MSAVVWPMDQDPEECKKWQMTIAQYKEGDPCTHQSRRWTGSMPCTGQYRCLTCGRKLLDSWEYMDVVRMIRSGFKSLFREMESE